MQQYRKYRRVAMVSSIYRPTRQQRFSSLSFYDDGQRLWDARDNLMQKLSEDDLMSDTDSDDEPVEEDEPIYPSIAMCRNLFEKDEEAIEEVEDDQNKDEAADKDEATDEMRNYQDG